MKKGRILMLTTLLVIMVMTTVYAANGATLKIENENPKNACNGGEEFSVSVNLSAVQDGAESLGAAMVYDNTKLELLQYQEGNVSVSIENEDRITFACFSNKQGKKLEAGNLLTAKFRVKPNASGSAEIRFGNIILTDTDEAKNFTATTSKVTIKLSGKNQETTNNGNTTGSNNTGTSGGNTSNTNTGSENNNTSNNAKGKQWSDVKNTDWFYTAVQFAVENKLFNGMSETVFAPNSSMTRGMLVTVLYRLAGATDTKTSSFSDVKANMYYSAPIEWASQNGIVNGVGDNKFAPDKEISREDLATIIYRYITNKKISIDADKSISNSKYADENSIASYAKESVSALREKGLMTGKTASKFEPKANTTRAEVATLMMRLKNRMK